MRLERVAENTDPMVHEYASGRRVKALKAELEKATSTEEILTLKRKLAESLLNAGKSKKAVKAFKELRSLLKRHDPSFLKKNDRLIQIYLATSYLRVGEQQNCLDMSQHTSESCLLPIQGGGVYELPYGPRHAKKVLLDLLERYPNDLSGQWLLNVACMTLGEYPEEVPEQWRVPPRKFESDYDIGRFPEMASKAGLATRGLAGGVAVEDFNRDGHLDVMVSSWGLRDPLRLYRNNGDGTFMERTEAAHLTGLVGGLNLVQADYDNDGDTDVFVLRGGWLGRGGNHPNSLLRNNGDGTFSDVTESAGLLSRYPTQTATWIDYNQDGLVDLFIGNESFQGGRHPCELYRNNGDGTFTDVAPKVGADKVAFVKAVVSADYDRDGRPDLFLSVLGGPNMLLRNEGVQQNRETSHGGIRFRDVARQAGVTQPIHSFPSWFWDYNNDGLPDLFVAGYQLEKVEHLFAEYFDRETGAEPVKLFRNNGDGTFTDVSQEMAIDKVLYAMGVNFGDLDNDGFQDFYVGTGIPDMGAVVPNRMFRNAAGKRFQDVTFSGGFGHIQKGHGVAFADMDGDGDQDIMTVMGGFFTGDVYMNALFQNPGHQNHWLKLRLQGVSSNRSAIGARIRVSVRTKSGGTRNLHRTVGTGGSFGANPLVCHIGLGDAQAIHSVKVRWPASGTTQSFDQVEMDTHYRIKEGKGQLIQTD